MTKSVKQPVETPPYLKSVRIRDYAPLRDAKVDFKPGLNIIIGNNGVGKTRFLNLTSQAATHYQNHEEGEGCELVFGYDPDIKIALQQASGDSLDNVRIGERTVLEVAITYGITEAKGSNLMEALHMAGVNVDINVVLAQHGTPLKKMPLAEVPATLNFGTTARGMRIEPRVSDWVDDPQRPLLPFAMFTTLSMSFFYWRQQQRRVSKVPSTFSINEAQQEVKRITTAFIDFLNPTLALYSPIKEVRLSQAFQVYNNDVQQETSVKGLVLEYSVGGSWLPFEALSDGTKRLLYLISQLAMPTAKFGSSNTFPPPFELRDLPRIFLLEEPELGIHPEQLHKLLSLIREVSREHQVIMTTHSPQVLDMLSEKELDRITICELDPKKGTQFRKLSRAKQDQARAYMREQLHLSDFWRYADLEAKD